MTGGSSCDKETTFSFVISSCAFLVTMADQYMDSILEQLPKLELEALVEVCDHFRIKYPGDKKGKRAIVVTAFMSFVTKDDILESADQ